MRQVIEWEKIFVIPLFNRGLTYRIHKKNSYKLVRKKQELTTKMSKRLA